MTQESSVSEKAYQMLTSEDDGRLCRDIPEESCNHQPKNFITHIIALSMTKTSDGLIDPKLVLSWLLTTLGASSFWVGLLVPVREAGALLPQLFIAEWVRRRPIRKWVWAAGSLVQGLSVLGMLAAALTLNGEQLGFVVVVLLAVLAIARSFCSVSYKDVLGKTVSKSTRGTATGTAGSIAASGVILFGLLLVFSIIPLTVFGISCALAIAAGFWIAAASIFGQLAETSGATEGGENASRNFLSRIQSVLSDRQLIRFIVVRALLIATALAPPFILLAGGSFEQQEANETIESLLGNNSLLDSQLGLYILASSFAGLLSSYLWGRLADKSSRKVLILSSLIAACGLASIVIANYFCSELLKTIWFLPISLFVVMLAYQGVRLGRSTHLVDMTHQEQRANYTAVSNSIIGVFLMLGGLFGLIADQWGVTLVLIIFVIMCLLAFFFAWGLKEVQNNNS